MGLRTIKYSRLNVVATPHPEGIYERALNVMIRRPVNYRADQMAVISNLMQESDGIIVGRLILGTVINLEDPIFSSENFEEIEEIPQSLRVELKHLFNGRVFTFFFDSYNHKITIETINEFGKTLSIKTSRKIFDQLFEKFTEQNAEYNFRVTIVERSNALDAVLSTPQIRKLEIEVLLPNPDTPDSVGRVLQRIEQQRLRKESRVLVKEPNALSIIPDEETRAFAEASQRGNGKTTAIGKTANGKKIVQSTEDLPEEIPLKIDTDQENPITSGLAVARNE